MTLFVDPTRAKEFECVICMEIYKEPVQIGCQEHVFCKQCIDQLISVNGNSFNCPLCQHKCTAATVTRVKFIDRQIRDLQVKCPNKTVNKQFIGVISPSKNNSIETLHTNVGQKRQRSHSNTNDNNMNHNKRMKLNETESCQWKGAYSDLNNHIEKCPLQLTGCIYCGKFMLRKQLKKHSEECLMFPMKCNFCNKSKIYRKDMPAHVFESCPLTEIKCVFCQQDIIRKDEQFHLQTDCPESFINCRFYPFGCMEKLKRKNEKQHLENAEFTHSHLIQLANHQLKLEGIVNTLKRENKALDARINVLENKFENYISGNNDENDEIIDDDVEQCYVCGKNEELLRCSACKNEFYCSREHQVSDWPRHSRECRHD